MSNQFKRWADATNDDEEDLRAEALKSMKSNWIHQHGVRVITSAMEGYESGGETCHRIVVVI